MGFDRGKEKNEAKLNSLFSQSPIGDSGDDKGTVGRFN